jgi:hypothetical protein
MPAAQEAAFSEDDARKATYPKVQRPDFCGRFEHFLSTNGSSPGFAVGNQASFADALIFALLWDEEGLFGKLDWAAWPRLAALHKRFGAIQKVAEWCAKNRPSAAA